MIYLVTYDIENDKIRSKIAKQLKAIGQRVQKSIFECELSKVQLSTLEQKLTELLNTQPESGSTSNIRIYPICMDCHQKSLGVGQVTKSIYSTNFIIL